ncbi:hypothetical protein HK104_002432 [Borealophlyctis nickersoniae]|nr:hypothetical protein HK104_002432 [Borealophlyctis nickersoniae]
MYANELPRIYTSNPSIIFETTSQESGNCSISLTFDNGKSKEINLTECPTVSTMYGRLVGEIGAAAKGGDPSEIQ